MSDETKIEAINASTVARICSGQVITDMATAVKELLENAIDAGAKSVEIKLRECGLELIEVVDNGSGIAPCNYEGLTLKYHTSKISKFDDLRSVSSFGFRGEALSSLCELSGALSITTRAADQPIGVRLSYNRAGKLIKQEPKARPQGTTVSVENLFAPLPVRQKEFKRNIKKQYQKLLRVLQGYALVSVGVRISVVNKTSGHQKRLLATQGNDKLSDNVVAVFGIKCLEGLVPLEVELPGGEGKITGMVSKAGEGVGRSDSDRQFCFLNGRPVELDKVMRAVQEVWRQYEMKHRPAAIIMLDLPPGSFDVNVTPDKREVFLSNEAAVIVALRAELNQLWVSSRHTFKTNQFQQSSLAEMGFSKTASGQEAGKGGTGGKNGQEMEKVTKGKEVIAEGSDDGEEDDEALGDNDDAAAAGTSQGASKVKASTSPDGQNRAYTTMGDGDDEGDTVACKVGPPDGSGDEREQGRGRRSTHRLAKEKKHGKPGDIRREEPMEPEEEDGERTRRNDKVRRGRADPSQCMEDDEAETPVEPQNEKGSSSGAVLARQGSKVKGTRPARASRGNDAAGLQSRGGGKPSKGLAAFVFGASPSAKEVEAEEQSEVEVVESSEDERKQAADVPELAADSMGSKLGNEAADGEQEKDSAKAMELGKATADGADEGECTSEAVAVKCTEIVQTRTNATDADAPAATVATTETARQLKASEAGSTQPAARAPSNGSDGASDHISDGSDSQNHNKDQPEVIEVGDDAPAAAARGSKPPSLTIATAAPPEWRFDPALALLSCARRVAKKRKHATLMSAASAVAATSVSTASACGTAEKDTDAAAKALSRVLTKQHFKLMNVVGQFNLGFIVCQLGSDLFILDQHASDEKANFEVLQRNTKIHQQPLVQPLPLEVSASEEITIRDNLEVFQTNGFNFEIDEAAPTTKRLKITSIPFSKGTAFGVEDVHELASVISNSHGQASSARLPKVRAMFAMRACRSSIMIGTSLNKQTMTKVVRKLAEIDQPWNCPHGRPTLRFLSDVSPALKRAAECMEIDAGDGITPDA